MTKFSVLGVLLVALTGAAVAQPAAGSAAPAAGSAAAGSAAPAAGSAAPAAGEPMPPPREPGPPRMTPIDARRACAAAMNADPTFASAIVKVADEAAARRRDAETVSAHLDAVQHIERNERHVIYAYAAMWIIAAGFVLFLWRRQQGLQAEIAQLRRDLEAAAEAAAAEAAAAEAAAKAAKPTAAKSEAKPDAAKPAADAGGKAGS